MRKAMSFTLIVGSIFLAVAARGSVAQGVAPDVLVKSVTDEVIAVIRKNSGTLDAAKVAGLVETKIAPHFDFLHMARLAMGRNWRLASAGQQKALSEEFKTLLVHTYSASLAQYRDQEIEFYPMRAAPGDAEVTVRSAVKQSGGQPIQINYDMEKTPTGWKVYNVSIEGISLVITYRSSFASQVRDRGVDGLIKMLADKNRSNDSSAKRDGA